MQLKVDISAETKQKTIHITPSPKIIPTKTTKQSN